VIQAAVIEAVSVDQAEDFLTIGTELVGEMNLLGQMMKYEQGAVKLDLFDLGFRQGGGEYSFAVGFATDITNMALDHLAVDPAILHLGEIDATPAFDLTDEAHSGSTIH
jgi:hypothetical protein